MSLQSVPSVRFSSCKQEKLVEFSTNAALTFNPGEKTEEWRFGKGSRAPNVPLPARQSGARSEGAYCSPERAAQQLSAQCESVTK